MSSTLLAPPSPRPARWSRLLRHSVWDERRLLRHVPPAALARLQAAVQASEARHQGELRLSIEAHLPWGQLWRRTSPRERALELFSQLRVWDTEHNSGVLVYLLMADRAIEIVADRGLARHVPAAQWQALAAAMREPFRQGQFEAGLMLALDQLTTWLVAYAPQTGPTRSNELPDAPDVR